MFHSSTICTLTHNVSVHIEYPTTPLLLRHNYSVIPCLHLQAVQLLLHLHCPCHNVHNNAVLICNKSTLSDIVPLNCIYNTSVFTKNVFFNFFSLIGCQRFQKYTYLDIYSVSASSIVFEAYIICSINLNTSASFLSLVRGKYINCSSLVVSLIKT